MRTIKRFNTITSVINMSIRQSVVPDDFKQALVNPLIKNQNLRKMK